MFSVCLGLLGISVNHGLWTLWYETSAAHLQASKSHLGSRQSNGVAEDDEPADELPPDFQILPVYQKILEEPLPPMEIFSPFKAEEGEIGVVITKMDTRLRKNHTYRAFMEETRELLVYVLNEIKIRKTLQGQLLQREKEMMGLIEHYKRDPRVTKVLMLADHWRANNEQSEERVQSLLQEIQSITADFKLLESKMFTMQKRQEKLEAQIHKNKTCEHEKEVLEEHILSKEKAMIVMGVHVDQLTTALTDMTTETAQKEQEFKAKLDAAPDRHAARVAALTRELEVMSLEKDYKVQEARDLHEHVNGLIVENSRTSDRVKLLTTSVKQMKAQVRSMEARHRIVMTKNKVLARQLDVNNAVAKTAELEIRSFVTQNSLLQKRVQDLTTQMKAENNRYTSALRTVSLLDIENKKLKEEVTETKYANRNLQKNIDELEKFSRQNEFQAANCARLHQKENQKVKEMQRKVTVSARHIRAALHNINIMGQELDKNADMLRVLDIDLLRCQAENDKSHSTITHLYRVLDTKENLIRLQVKENDALVISKNRMVESLRSCFNSKNKLQNEVSRVHSVKTALEDAAYTQKFMLEFVQSERDGALRNRKQSDEAVVILQRKQIARIAQITRANEKCSLLRVQLDTVHRQLTVQKKEVHSLHQALKMAEGVIKGLGNSYKTLLMQRDMFGSRILQQNNEAEISRIKLETMMNVMDNGHMCYRDRCNDIKVLKKEIQNLRRKIKALEHTESLCHDLRTEVAYLSKGIVLEMNKRAAIERCKMPKPHRNRELQ
ncbi:hypothetical protein RRG08_014275, partial [Elysia crispata]